MESLELQNTGGGFEDDAGSSVAEDVRAQQGIGGWNRGDVELNRKYNSVAEIGVNATFCGKQHGRRT